MESQPKKSQQADLENKRLIFWQIGVILSLALVFFAFEYRTEGVMSMRQIDRWIDDAPIEHVPATTQPRHLTPPPPAPPVKIEMIDNLAEEKQNISFDAAPAPGDPIHQSLPKLVEEMPVEEPPMLVPEISPEFPGGMQALMAFLSNNMRYPALARAQMIQGRVYLSFVVEKDGTVTNIQLLRGIGGGCDEEALRVVGLMPAWKPGRQNGKPVRVVYNLPVRFSLQ